MLESAHSLRPLDTFARRHLGSGEADVGRMLSAVGYPTVDALIDAAVPAGIRLGRGLQLPAALSESEALSELAGIAAQNAPFRSYIGQGYHETLTPGVIQRNILENPGWYTAYTPYQAEIAQGRLEALLNFQTMVCDLTGLEISNASMLDEGTAAAEAMDLMPRGQGRGWQTAIVLRRSRLPPADDRRGPHPRAMPLGHRGRGRRPRARLELDATFCGALLQYPDTDGAVRDYAACFEKAHAAGAHGRRRDGPARADAAQAAGRIRRRRRSRHRAALRRAAGLRRTARGFLRHAGRVQAPHARAASIGVSQDAQGNPRHAPRAADPRATYPPRQGDVSNICTAQVLLAVMASMYAVYHGPRACERSPAACTPDAACWPRRCASSATKSRRRRSRFSIRCVIRASADAKRACTPRRGQEDQPAPLDADTLGISLDETDDRADLEDLLRRICAKLTRREFDRRNAHRRARAAFARRESAFLTHPVFNTLSHRDTRCCATSAGWSRATSRSTTR